MPNYDVEWKSIDAGREGLWKFPIWKGVLEIVARHEGEEVYDEASDIYLDLEKVFPSETWRSTDKGKFRPLFRDYPQPWTQTQTLDISDHKFKLTPLGKQLVTGRISPNEVFLKLLYSYTENGEKPFRIIATAFSEVNRPLSLIELYCGVMQGFRPGDDIQSSLTDSNTKELPSATTPVRRLKFMLLLMERSGLISVLGNDSWAIWDNKLVSEFVLKPSIKPAAASIDIKKLVDSFIEDLHLANINFDKPLLCRFCTSPIAKRFLVLTGLAGSGKTKIAQAFARWITPDPGWIDDADHSQGKNPNPYYALVPVGADWTGNENIIGYPNGLDSETYVTKPSLELIRHALDHVNGAIPHFLILDEMNLSHVERYFADILSAIESGEEIPLYEGTQRMTDGRAVPRKLRLPDNLFIIGTVNVDETTYMFSPKVLDRANVIEFRMEPAELAAFLSSPKAPRLEELDGKGTGFGSGFVEASGDKGREVPAVVKADFEREMLLLFNLLREHNAEFGYRTSYETVRFIHFYNQLGGYANDNGEWFGGAMDAVVVQKILPKLHGSRSKLEGLLWALAWACGAERVDRDGKNFAEQLREASQAQDEAKYGPELLWSTLAIIKADDPAAAARYPLSFDKVMRMWRKLVRDQFVTFSEA